MNIFVLDRNIRKCAQYHNDKHLVKMILETAQLLCSAHWSLGSDAPYKATHKNHPCAIWTRESKSNYIWLCKLGIQLCVEFEYRRGKKHSTKQVISWCLKNIPKLDDKGLTDFALAMPDEFKIGNVVECYRSYYLNNKRHLATWNKRGEPHWWS